MPHPHQRQREIVASDPLPFVLKEHNSMCTRTYMVPKDDTEIFYRVVFDPDNRKFYLQAFVIDIHTHRERCCGEDEAHPHTGMRVCESTDDLGHSSDPKDYETLYSAALRLGHLRA